MAQQNVSICRKPALSVVYDCNPYWNKVMGQAAVYIWFRPIKKGQQLLKDNLQKGTLVTACNKTAVVHVKENW
jgi:hypothetical protein